MMRAWSENYLLVTIGCPKSDIAWLALVSLNVSTNPSSVQFCSYTIQPSSTIQATALPFTSCHATSRKILSTSICECSGEGTSIRYPTGSQSCVFSSVPTATVSLPTLAGQSCESGLEFAYTCDYYEKTIVSRHSETEIKGDDANGSLFSSSSVCT